MTPDDYGRRVAALEARTDAEHSAQHDTNKRIERSVSALFNRMTAVERRVAFWAGAAAAVGSLGGALLSALLEK